MCSSYDSHRCAKEIPARVGLRKNTSLENNDIYGDTLHVNGSTDDLRSSASTSRASSLPQQSAPLAKVNDYLVGVHLDEALAAGQDIFISWPFADGDVRDWTQAEAVWYICSHIPRLFIANLHEGNTSSSTTSSFDGLKMNAPSSSP